MEPFECVSSDLGSYGSVWQAREAGQHNPICMYSKHSLNSKLAVSLGAFGERLEASGIVSERFGSSWADLERSNAFRALRERMGSFGRLGRLGRLGKRNPIRYVWYGM